MQLPPRGLPTAIMNNRIIPVPDEVLKYHSLFFDLTTPITLPSEEFDKVWPFVSSVYSAKQRRVIENGTLRVSKFECRLQRHGSSARESHQCQVRIRIVRILTLDDSEL
jgi:hypothetical protein